MPDSTARPDVSEYDTGTDVPTSELDIASDEHPVKQVLGESEHRAFEYEPSVTGERFAFRYDTPAAALREFLANAETACIRRARRKLEEAGIETDAMDPREVIVKAREYVDYHATIEVEHSAPQSSMPALTVEDNGVGIAVKEFLVMKKVGFSTSHNTGNELGDFGQGIMSGFTLVDKYGDFQFTTKSVLDDSSYSERVTLNGFNDLDGTRDRYGTTFTFPSFGDDAREVDIQAAVEKYTQQLRVPVLYREYDNSGNEIENEEYTYSALDAEFDRDDLVIQYEDDAVEALMGPDVRGRDRDPKTFLVSMPIERNSNVGVTSTSTPCRWQFDVRLKHEDGRIYECNCEYGDHEGLIPIADAGYEQLDADDRDRYVRQSQLSDDITMPTPVDDRDRLESGNDEFFECIAERLDNRYQSQAELFLEQYLDDGVDALLDLNGYDLHTLLSWYQHNGPNSSDYDVDDVQDKLQENTELEFTREEARKLDYAASTVSLAPRGHDVPNRKGDRTSTPILDVLSKAGDDGDVYMGATVTKKKARLAWALHEDNQVVGVSGTDAYDELEEDFGWKKLKELPSRNIEDKLDVDLDEDLLEDIDNAYGESSSSSGGGYSLDPKSRTVKVRYGKYNGSYTRETGKDVYTTFDNGDSITTGLVTMSELLVLRSTNDPSQFDYGKLAKNGVGFAFVPNYVYDYLESADNIYTSVKSLQQSHTSTEVTTYPIADGSVQTGSPSTATLDELGDDTLTLVASQNRLKIITGQTDRLPDVVENVEEIVETAVSDLESNATNISNIADYDRFATVSESTAESNWLAFPHTRSYPDDSVDVDVGIDGDVVVHTKADVKPISGNHWGSGIRDILVDHIFPEERFPRDAPEWETMAKGNFTGLIQGKEETVSLVETLLAMDEHTPDNEPVFASQK